jgi:hypothetical protein
MALPVRERLARALGFQTKRSKQEFEDSVEEARKNARKRFFLEDDRERSLIMFPELAPVFSVQDAALSFYQDILVSTQSSISTNRRNLLRAQAVAIKALDLLDKNQEIPPYHRTGRQEEANEIKSDELYNLRYELQSSFTENTRVNPSLLLESEARYAQFSMLYFKNPKEAITQFPELLPLEALEKQANRYFKGNVIKGKLDKAIKECVHRAIWDIARFIPVQQAIEIKADANTLKNSLIGEFVSEIKTDKNNNYVYSVDLMQSLIGKNGLKTGFWGKDTTVYSDKVQNIERTITEMQWRTAFNSLSKDDVLKNFPELNVLYNKQDSAIRFYSEKMATPFAQKAASLLIKSDFKRILEGKPLLAVSEVSREEHDKIIETVKNIQHLSGKSTHLFQNDASHKQGIEHLISTQNKPFSEESFKKTTPVSLDSNEMLDYKKTIDTLKAEIKTLQSQLNPDIEEKIESSILLSETSLNEKPEKNTPTFQLDSLRSTAPILPIGHLFTTSHKTAVNITETAEKHWDINAINAGLKANAEDVAIALLGEPLSRTGNQLRFGRNKGSLVLTTKGDKQGLWFDHQTGLGGNLLTLIKEQHNDDFKAALEFSGNFLQLTPENAIKKSIDMSDLPPELGEEKARLTQYARQLANDSEPIKGTLAETYLTKTRGIDIDLCSDNIRFLPAVMEPETKKTHPAVLIIGKTIEGKVNGVQVVYLNEEGQKLDCQEPKRSYGIIKGSAVPVHVGGNLYAVAEGVETALSVAMACKDMTIFASLGSITNFSAMDFKAQNNTLIIFSDNDQPGNPSNRKMALAADELSEKGFNVLVCKPKEVGKDFNDVLKEKGVDALKQEINDLKLHTSLGNKSPKISLHEGKLREKKFETEHGLGL